MSAQKIVHLPTAAEVEEAKLSSRTLSKYADVDRVQLSLRGSNGESDELVLPGHVLQILLDVLHVNPTLRNLTPPCIDNPTLSFEKVSTPQNTRLLQILSTPPWS